MNTNDTVKIIRKSLQKRSGKTWSVRHGRGTASGWIHVNCPPKRFVGDGSSCMSVTDRMEISQLMGWDKTVGSQGFSVPDSDDYYREYSQRAQGLTPSKIAQPYWD